MSWNDPLANNPRYASIRTISKGARSFVQLALDRSTGEQVAIKFTMRGWDLSKNKYLLRELLIHQELSACRHPHIVELREVFLTPLYLAAVMEHVDGEDLQTFLTNTGGRVSEALGRFLFQQLILALDFCHAKGKVSRAVKLANTLLALAPGQLPLVKLADFGFSKDTGCHSAPQSQVGTALFVAPEVMHNFNNAVYDGAAVDVWAAGIVLFILLFGRHPFLRPEDSQLPEQQQMLALFTRTAASQFCLLPEEAGSITPSCADLLGRMLQTNPKMRSTMAQIQVHPWFRQGLPEGAATMNATILADAAARPFLPRQAPEAIAALVRHGQVLDPAALSNRFTTGGPAAGPVAAAPGAAAAAYMQVPPALQPQQQPQQQQQWGGMPAAAASPNVSQGMYGQQQQQQWLMQQQQSVASQGYAVPQHQVQMQMPQLQQQQQQLYSPALQQQQQQQQPQVYSPAMQQQQPQQLMGPPPPQLAQQQLPQPVSGGFVDLLQSVHSQPQMQQQQPQMWQQQQQQAAASPAAASPASVPGVSGGFYTSVDELQAPQPLQLPQQPAPQQQQQGPQQQQHLQDGRASSLAKLNSADLEALIPLDAFQMDPTGQQGAAAAEGAGSAAAAAAAIGLDLFASMGSLPFLLSENLDALLQPDTNPMLKAPLSVEYGLQQQQMMQQLQLAGGYQQQQQQSAASNGPAGSSDTDTASAAASAAAPAASPHKRHRLANVGDGQQQAFSPPTVQQEQSAQAAAAATAVSNNDMPPPPPQQPQQAAAGDAAGGGDGNAGELDIPEDYAAFLVDDEDLAAAAGGAANRRKRVLSRVGGGTSSISLDLRQLSDMLVGTNDLQLLEGSVWHKICRDMSFRERGASRLGGMAAAAAAAVAAVDGGAAAAPGGAGGAADGWGGGGDVAGGDDDDDGDDDNARDALAGLRAMSITR